MEDPSDNSRNRRPAAAQPPAESAPVASPPPDPIAALERRIVRLRKRKAAEARRLRNHRLVSLGAALTAGSSAGFSWADPAPLAVAEALSRIVRAGADPSALARTLAQQAQQAERRKAATK